MPWTEVSIMSQREEFVALAQHEQRNLSQLAERYGVSRQTAYKWLRRFAAAGAGGLHDRSRQPQHSPHRTPAAVEQTIIAARQAHPAWGARKLWHWLSHQAGVSRADLPAASTIQAILQRHGLINPAEALNHQPFQRFEYAAPNQLWQMDFKGDFRLRDAARTRCYPLTVLDDHSRFALALRACWDQRTETVQTALREVFRTYGLPERMTMDNGAPWGDEGGQPYTRLTVWLVQIGIHISHSRPYHPQTQGKDERFHRTLDVELLRDPAWSEPQSCQVGFDGWRQVYNLERPHQALGYAVPAQRYQPSARPFPETLPAIEYGPDDQVRKVQEHGQFSFRGQTYRISKAFHGHPIGLRLLAEDEWHVYFCQHALGSLNLRTHSTTGHVTYVPERV
ncbi:MAG: IS481 family transposase [Chloroflexi bacterium]|nr:IS481 family transposase [Chloroflexota bacterium]